MKAQAPPCEGLYPHIRKFGGGLLAPGPPGEFERAERITTFLSEFLYNRKTFSSYKDIIAG